MAGRSHRIISNRQTAVMTKAPGVKLSIMWLSSLKVFSRSG